MHKNLNETNIKKIEELMEIASNSLQDIEDILEENWCQYETNINIKFPRRFIRTCSSFREKYENLGKRQHLKNISYSLQLTDIFHYLLNRFDLDYSVKWMIIKNWLLIIWWILEISCRTLLRLYWDPKQQIPKKFSHVLKRLKEFWIDRELCKHINEIRELRNNTHIQLIRWNDYDHYDLEDYNLWIILINEINKLIEEATSKIND